MGPCSVYPPCVMHHRLSNVSVCMQLQRVAFCACQTTEVLCSYVSAVLCSSLDPKDATTVGQHKHDCHAALWVQHMTFPLQAGHCWHCWVLTRDTRATKLLVPSSPTPTISQSMATVQGFTADMVVVPGRNTTCSR
jgi:hypothetical protein